MKAFVLTTVFLVVLTGCQQEPPVPRPVYLAPIQGPESYGPPGTAVMPATHDADWLRMHGAQAKGGDCAVCHIEADCVSCHVDTWAMEARVHPPNYALLHSVEARQGLTDCTTCHRLDTFCQACHAETRVVPELAYAPPSSVAFHPPGWLDVGAPNNHGIQARRDIQECASCHIETDCISCHVGINPHPPEFRFQCQTWLQADASSCARCHLDTSNLESLCW